MILSLETDPTAPSDGKTSDASLPAEVAQVTRLSAVVISDQAFGEAERMRIGHALSAVLPNTIFSAENLTFLDRGVGSTTPSPRADVPAVPGLHPLFEKFGITEVMTSRSRLAIVVGGAFLVLFSILAALLMRGKRKGLTPEEHREFAQLLKLEFAPAEEPAR